MRIRRSCSGRVTIRSQGPSEAPDGQQLRKLTEKHLARLPFQQGADARAARPLREQVALPVHRGAPIPHLGQPLRAEYHVPQLAGAGGPTVRLAPGPTAAQTSSERLPESAPFLDEQLL